MASYQAGCPAKSGADIDAVASMFQGFWVLNPGNFVAYSTADDVRTSISGALDSLVTRLQEIAPKPAEHGGIGHNGPPEEEPIAAEEVEVALRAVDDMRLAISSKDDTTVLDTIWFGLSSIANKLGTWLLRKVEVFFDNFVPAAGKALGKKLPSLLIAAVGLWFGHMDIAALIAILLTFK